MESQAVVSVLIFYNAGVTEKDVERFWSKVDRRSNDECWLWCGAIYRHSDCVFRPSGKRGTLPHIASRLAYQLYFDCELTSGKQLYKTCHNSLCVNPHHNTPDRNQMFWLLVDRKSENECWPWLGHRDEEWGYGKLHYQQRSQKAHRIAYLLTYGELPANLLVCHTCDNPPCCNPSHLFLGTHLDNARDRDMKNRQAESHGEFNSAAKLNENQVKEMRMLFEQGTRQCDLVKTFGLSKAQVSAIIKRKAWAHI